MQINQIELVQAGDATHKGWSAQVQRQEQNSREWHITRGPDGQRPPDGEADGELLETLLINSASFKATGGSGTSKTTTPIITPELRRLTLKLWRSRDSVAAPDLLLEVGTPALEKILQRARVLSSFDHLRAPNWVGLSLEELSDIKEITWRRGPHIYFIAHKTDSSWTDQQFMATDKKITEWLKAAAVDRFKRVVEPFELAQSYKKILLNAPDLEIVMKDRKDRVVQLSLGRVHDRMIGVSSFRPHAVFEIFPTTMKSFRVPE